MRELVINYKKGEYFPSLNNILMAIRGNIYEWSIFDMWATASTKKVDILSLEEKTKRNSGYHLSWRELLYLSSNLDQFIEGLLVASVKTEDLKRYKSNTELIQNCSIVIELIDSSTWEIKSHDAHIIDHMMYYLREQSL